MTARNLITRIGEFKYINIKDLVNNIRNSTISEIAARKVLSALNKIKNTEMIKYRKRTPNHKELLNLLNNLLDAILTDKTESESREDKYENENAKKKKKKTANSK